MALTRILTTIAVILYAVSIFLPWLSTSWLSIPEQHHWEAWFWSYQAKIYGYNLGKSFYRYLFFDYWLRRMSWWEQGWFGVFIFQVLTIAFGCISISLKATKRKHNTNLSSKDDRTDSQEAYNPNSFKSTLIRALTTNVPVQTAIAAIGAVKMALPRWYMLGPVAPSPLQVAALAAVRVGFRYLTGTLLGSPILYLSRHARPKGEFTKNFFYGASTVAPGLIFYKLIEASYTGNLIIRPLEVFTVTFMVGGMLPPLYGSIAKSVYNYASTHFKTLNVIRISAVLSSILALVICIYQWFKYPRFELLTSLNFQVGFWIALISAIMLSIIYLTGRQEAN